MPYSYPVIIEILELAHELGEIPEFRVTDTAPWVKAYTTPGGTFVPEGWKDRPRNDGWHWYGKAVDIGGYNQKVLADWWLRHEWLLLELIHKLSPGRGYVVQWYTEKTWTPAWDHEDHVHVAMDWLVAVKLRDQLKAKLAEKNKQTVVLGQWVG